VKGQKGKLFDWPSESTFTTLCTQFVISALAFAIGPDVFAFCNFFSTDTALRTPICAEKLIPTHTASCRRVSFRHPTRHHKRPALSPCASLTLERLLSQRSATMSVDRRDPRD
ncbi:uncharacterized protein METZ01_LOCUS453349, partial [marine metagenome]